MIDLESIGAGWVGDASKTRDPDRVMQTSLRHRSKIC